ncbi:hypothetical protein KC316_g4773 [Hortaea werneckii]|nr:hypothetical protein KC324_g3569 [Hortaea werneckii]KAI7587891.1 hypothetical protein KC316_g4773 [Hortaea werneckii]RMX99996.1 hypothetical protein D0868_09242 [Hortaea werneckii]
MWTSKALAYAWTAGLTLARSPVDPEGWEDGSDLHHFVTRPDLTAPRYNVAKYHPESIAPGYWFVAPYSSLYDQPSFNGRKEHISGQTGAHIYDADGNLVWSAASKYHNRNVFNLQPVNINETHQLAYHLAGSDSDDGYPKHSSQVFADSSYEEVGRINEASRGGPVDFHAFKVLPGAETALISSEWWDTGNLTQPDGQDPIERPILNAGFAEVKLNNPGEALFQWDAYKSGLSLDECYDEHGLNQQEGYWDYIHENSVDKDSQGDYYVSARHTNTIYKVSKDDGHIEWRLGGKRSDFKVLDPKLTFYWQHHVRVRSVNASHTVLTVFDNASEDQGRNSSIPESASAAKIILLDTINMEASLLRYYDRPNGGKSRKLGDVQQLHEGDIMQSSIFVDWAEQGHIAEYDSEGRMVLEAQFASPRMSTYRAYKFSWVGQPKENPVCKLLPMNFALKGHHVATAFYVSWNGATEVLTWEFYGGDEMTEEGFEKLGSTPKDGFETTLVIPGIAKFGYAVALDKDGKELGRSETMSLLPPQEDDLKPLSSVTPGIRKLVEQSDDTAKPYGSSPRKEVASGNHSALVELLLTVGTFAVYAFAAFGVYSLVKMLLPSFTGRWQRGYKPLRESKYSDEHVLESTGRDRPAEDVAYRMSTEGYRPT